MAQVWAAVELGADMESAEDPVQAVDPDASTRPILMGCINHLLSECTLISHDLDKLRGQLTTVEVIISYVEDTSHTHGAHLLEFRDLVRSLQHRADDVEDRQRRNNIKVMGLREGAEGDKPVPFAEL